MKCFDLSSYQVDAIDSIRAHFGIVRRRLRNPQRRVAGAVCNLIDQTPICQWNCPCCWDSQQCQQMHQSSVNWIRRTPVRRHGLVGRGKEHLCYLIITAAWTHIHAQGLIVSNLQGRQCLWLASSMKDSNACAGTRISLLSFCFLVDFVVSLQHGIIFFVVCVF